MLIQHQDQAVKETGHIPDPISSTVLRILHIIQFSQVELLKFGPCLIQIIILTDGA